MWLSTEPVVRENTLLWSEAFFVVTHPAAINRAQFNTPPPLHCVDSRLSQGAEAAMISLEIPTTDSHVCQLHKRK
jgi:hypothetical protein